MRRETQPLIKSVDHEMPDTIPVFWWPEGHHEIVNDGLSIDGADSCVFEEMGLDHEHEVGCEVAFLWGSYAEHRDITSVVL